MPEADNFFKLKKLSSLPQKITESSFIEKLSKDYFNTYLGGLKDKKNRPINFQYILGLKPDISFGEFIEEVKYTETLTEYAGLRISDPNWYEEGNYKVVAIEPELFLNLEKNFRSNQLLKPDERLHPVTYYTDKPSFNGGQKLWKRPDMLISVSGGSLDHWIKYVALTLEDNFLPFRINQNIESINVLQKMTEEN
jgi:hypothetical protein